MQTTSFLVCFLLSCATALKYDPSSRPLDEPRETFSMQELQDLYEDWDSITMGERVKFFPVTPEKLFPKAQKAKGIIERLSDEIYLSKLKIHGFEDKQWQYWTAPNGTAPCDQCTYKMNGTVGAERYYGGFSARVRSVEAKLNLTIDGEKKECDVIGLSLKRNSVAHNTVAGEEEVEDNLNFLRLFFDFSFIWSPPIGIEIKEWTSVDDWGFSHIGSRFHLETMKDNDTWPLYHTDFHTPLFHFYVDPKCLKLTYSQAKYFNRRLSKHLDYKITGLIVTVMKSHFLINAGRPYALYKLENSNHSRAEWAMEMITSTQSWLDDVGQWFEGAAKTTWDGLNEANRWIDQAGKDAGKWIDQAATDTGKWVDQAAKDTGNWVEQAAKDTGKWIDQAVKDVDEWSKTEEGAQTIANIAEGLREFAQSMDGPSRGAGRRPKMPRRTPPKRIRKG